MDALTRSFIGIRLPHEVQDRLAALQLDLKRRGGSDAVKWSQKEEMHLTLCFLGELRLDQVSSIQQAIASIGSGRSPMALSLGGLAGFPNNTQPRILAVNVEGDLEPLLALQSQLEQATAPYRTHHENKPFSPHITLGRLRTESEQSRTGMGRALRLVEAGPSVPWEAREFELMRNAIGPMGPTYATIQGYSLGTQTA